MLFQVQPSFEVLKLSLGTAPQDYLVRLSSKFATMLFIASKGFSCRCLKAPALEVTRLFGFTAVPNFPEFTTRSILLMMSNKDFEEKNIEREVTRKSGHG